MPPKSLSGKQTKPLRKLSLLNHHATQVRLGSCRVTIAICEVFQVEVALDFKTYLEKRPLKTRLIAGPTPPTPPKKIYTKNNIYLKAKASNPPQSLLPKQPPPCPPSHGLVPWTAKRDGLRVDLAESNAGFRYTRTLQQLGCWPLSRLTNHLKPPVDGEDW